MDRFNSTSASPRNSFPWNRALAGLVLACACFLNVSAQGRKDLERKRDALDKQIKQTSALIDQAKTAQQSTKQQV